MSLRLKPAEAVLLAVFLAVVAVLLSLATLSIIEPSDLIALPAFGVLAAAPPRRQAAPAPVRAIPFTAAAHEHSEPITVSGPTALGAAAVPFGPFDVPAYGYMRHIFMDVTLSGGTLGAGVLAADHPFNIFQSVSLLDVNGAPIFGPLDGYALYLANKWGAYGNISDPASWSGYSNTINGRFMVRVPVEIARHSGLGSLANQNAAASYKLNYTLNTSAAAYSTAPTTPANVTVRSFLEAWSLPNEVDLAGRPQAQVPPAHGTTQYWSAFQKNLVAGNQTILLPRVGNLIRCLIFVGRNATGARDDTVFPDPIQFMWDARILNLESQNYRNAKSFESLGPNSGRQTGIWPFLFNNLIQGQVGDEEANLWLPTVQSTRLELDGTSATTGTLQVITNDVAPVEVIPQERFVETSHTGGIPGAGGQPNVGAQA